ncbi:MAG: hypothetical protein NZ518_00940 [Dehalococcoidia bacterium]|nr:hypothetical protein [Dehalococcoidia bacterium]
MIDESYVHALQRRLREQQEEVESLTDQLGQARRLDPPVSSDELARLREQLLLYARDYAASVARYLALESMLHERAAELSAQNDARRSALAAAADQRRALLDMVFARWPWASRQLTVARRVAGVLGSRLGWSDDHRQALAALLDYAVIGWLATPDGVSPHSAGSDALVALFAQRLAESGGLEGRFAVALRHHRERFDGGGAPDGLREHAIPIESRVTRLALGVAAMTVPSDGAPPAHATLRRELARGAARLYDPALVNLALTSDEIALGPDTLVSE